MSEPMEMTDADNVRACGADFYRDLILENAGHCTRQKLYLIIQKLEKDYSGEINIDKYGLPIIAVYSASLPGVLVQLLDEVSYHMRVHVDFKYFESIGDADGEYCDCAFCYRKRTAKKASTL